MEKLIEIQSELKAPKGNFNSFGKYKYRSCEDILEAVKPLLKKHGCQLTLSDEPIVVGERIYIRATATIKCGEDVEVVTAYAREEDTKKGMDGSQITGTASSYARKYALNGLFLIDDTKDADTDEYHKQTNKKTETKFAEAPAVITIEQVREITALCNETQTDMEKMLGHYKVKAVKEMTPEIYTKCKNALEKKLK